MSRKLIQITFSIFLLAGMAFGFAMKDGALAQDNPTLKFEAGLLDKLDAGPTDFFVVMATQADLSAADKLQTKIEKGQYVFDTLVATANQTQADLRSYLDSQKVEYKTFYIVNAIMVKQGSLSLAQTIALRSDVAGISSNHTYQLDKPIINPDAPNSPTGVEPNISFVNAPQVWALGVTGQGMIIAGNDTGLDETHPAIKTHYRGCIDPPACTTYNNNYNWWDATGTYPNDPWDGFGHGTHTTGTMVGDDGAGNQIGMAPGAQTVHCKNMTDGGSGDDNTFLTCFQWDLAPWDLTGSNPEPSMAPDAINNSWGYWGGGANQFRNAINALQAAGILVEVSAGNEGAGCQTLRSPGDYWEVLTTGSVNHTAPYPGSMTGFSSRGPSILDPGLYFPDITAPGENIRSSVPGGGYEGGWSGTSMSGPHATGLIGLIWSANPALRGQVAQTIEIIHDTATPVTSYVGSCGGDYVTGPNNDWGFGTIDALAAVQEAIAMGGAGQLDGIVTDAVTGLPIDSANVHALQESGFAWDTETDVTGYYTMTVGSGLFDVTASHPSYESLTISGVEVITDQLTSQNFELVPRGTLVGTVTDFDNGFPLVGATIDVSDGSSTTTLDTGSYEIMLDQGTYTVTASMKDYAPVSAVVDIVSGGTTTQDFALKAAIVFTPSPLHVTLDMGTTYNTEASILNRLPTDYPFELREKDEGFVPSIVRSTPDVAPLPAVENPGTASVLDQSARFGTEQFAPDSPNAWVGATAYPQTIVRYAKVQCEGDTNSFYVLGGVSNGSIINNVRRFDADTNAWTDLAPMPVFNEGENGVCYEGKIYATEGGGLAGFNVYDIESNSWSQAAYMPRGLECGAIAAWNGKVFVIGGDDNFYPSDGVSDQVNIYDIETNTWVANGTPIPTGTSNPGFIQLGQFIYLAGGWGQSFPSNVNLLQRYDLDSDTWETAPYSSPRADFPLAATIQYLYAIAGDQDGGGYWDSSNTVTRYDFNSFPDDTWEDTGDPLPFAIQAHFGGFATASFTSGEIWSVGGLEGPTFTWHADNLYRESEPPWSPIPPDVPWLAEVPVSGTVPAGDTLPIDVSFTATEAVGVNQPGDYLATLKVNGDPSVSVPVIMTVLPPNNWGKLTGLITDNCTGLPVEEALVEIAGGVPITQTMTDETGHFTAWIVEGTYSVNFSAAGYVGTSGEYEVVAGETTTADVVLVPDRPCITVEPKMIEVWVLTDTQVYTSGGLQISNPGNQDLSFELSERDEGFAPLGLRNVTIPAGPSVAPAGSAAASGPYQPRPELTIKVPNSPSAGPRVLLACSDYQPLCEPIRTQLQAFGDFDVVDVFDAQYGTPTLAELQAYDVVLTWTNYVYQDAVGMGNVLADYVDAGGKVVNLMFAMGTHGWQMMGRFMDQGYTAMNGTSLYFVNTCLGNYDPTHPIMAGVTDVCDFYRMTGTYLTADSTAVAEWSDGLLFVAAKDDRTVVSINGYVGGAAQWTGQMDLVVHNAIMWLMGPTDVPWVWESPITGTISAGSLEDISIYFTAQYTDGTPMPLGTYSATLTIKNNDPIAKNQAIPLIMHIVEAYVAPEAGFIWGPQPTNVGEPTEFTNTTVEGVPPVTTFEWDFGDGTTATGSWAPIFHTYATFGTYLVSLTACNDAGCDTSTADVVVLPKLILLPLINRN